MSDELAFLDATAQADLVRRRKVSPAELVQAAITRIERVDRELNAVIIPLFEKARAEAAGPALPDGPFRGGPRGGGPRERRRRLDPHTRERLWARGFEADARPDVARARRRRELGRGGCGARRHALGARHGPAPRRRRGPDAGRSLLRAAPRPPGRHRGRRTPVHPRRRVAAGVLATRRLVVGRRIRSPAHPDARRAASAARRVLRAAWRPAPRLPARPALRDVHLALQHHRPAGDLAAAPLE